MKIGDKRGKNQRFFHNNFLNKNCRGQFYLIAPIVIVGILVGFVTILNYSKKTDYVGVYDLGKNLEMESEAVTDYVTISGDNKLENFTFNFDKYAGEDKEVYFITNSEGYFYNESIKQNLLSFANDSGKLSVKINEKNYEFEMKPGENFYFVILQDFGGEQYVVKN